MLLCVDDDFCVLVLFGVVLCVEIILCVVLI